MRVDLEDTSHGADAQPFGQRADGPHHQLGGDARAMQGRAMGLETIGPTGPTPPLPPPSTTGMTVGADIATPDPSVIGTAPTRAEMVLRIHRAWTSPDGDHRRRGRTESFDLHLWPVLTSGAGWLMGETRTWRICW